MQIKWKNVRLHSCIAIMDLVYINEQIILSDLNTLNLRSCNVDTVLVKNTKIYLHIKQWCGIKL